jgi:putative phosphoribosyl transferase
VAYDHPPLDAAQMDEDAQDAPCTRQSTVFADRLMAGERLAATLLQYRDMDTLVLGIPRGGIPVAASIAKVLGAELDVVIARKLGVPDDPELAMGAITATGRLYVDQDMVMRRGVSQAQLAEVIAHESAQASTRDVLFRGGRPEPGIAGRTVIVVDDGLATGATFRATLQAVRTQGPAHLVAAVPVGPREAGDILQSDADVVVCLHTQEPFEAVGYSYDDFRAVTDETVATILQSFRAGEAAGRGI